MVDFTKSYPDPVNIDKLIEDIRAQFPTVSSRDSDFTVYNVQAQDEATIDSIIAAHNPATLTNSQQIVSAQSGLQDKIALAHQATIAPHIKALFNATLQQTEDAAAQPTRYNNIMAAVEATNPGAFYNRFKKDLLEELGIDYTATPHSATQQRQICFFARVWSTQLALLLAQ